ncbi:M48 family metalloprotease [Agrobacterium sp. NPDC089420]|uniref:M48 family metalloprotease n=1 Tax=Agrobacterium sp. NPDC089420 TaxID=3363918 RepID=UPI0038507125
MTKRLQPHDSRWRALLWLAFGDAVLLISGVTLVLSPLLLGVFLRSPLLLVIFALPSATWFFYGLMVLRARAVPPPPLLSDTVLLNPDDVPALAADLERLRLACDAPAFEAVYINRELNASIYQNGSRSGSPQHILVLGLPLLALLTQAQAEAVIAHEYAHISRSHGHFARWAYRARQRWAALGDLHERNHRLITAPLRLFLSWYVPRLLRETLEFSRRCERLADAQAVEACGAAIALEAEFALALRQRAMATGFWPDVFSRAGEDEITVASPFTQLLAEPAACRPRDSAQAAVWLHESLCEKPDAQDTHPSLFERVETTGFDPSGPLPDHLPWRLDDMSAAAAWLGEHAPGIAAQLDANWREKARQSWDDASNRRFRQYGQFSNLLHRRRQQAFDAQDWWLLARLAEKFDASGSLRHEAIEQGLQQSPDDPTLLELEAGDLDKCGDVAGAIALWLRIGRDPSASPYTVHRHLCELYLRSGDRQEAERHRRSADDLWANEDAAQPLSIDRFAHGMQASELALLQGALQPVFAHARAIWLCCDTPPHGPTPTRWFLYIEAYDGWFMRLIGRLTGEEDYSASACKRLIERLSPRLHIDPEVEFIGPSGQIPVHCTPDSLIAQAGLAVKPIAGKP